MWKLGLFLFWEYLFRIFVIGFLQCSKRLSSISRILMLVFYMYTFGTVCPIISDFFSLFRPGCRTTDRRCRISRTQRLWDKRTRVQWFAGQRAKVQRFAGQPYRRPWRVRRVRGDWSRGHRQWKGEVCQFRGQAWRSRWRPRESDEETKRTRCLQFLPPTRSSKQICTLMPKLFFCLCNECRSSAVQKPVIFIL